MPKIWKYLIKKACFIPILQVLGIIPKYRKSKIEESYRKIVKKKRKKFKKYILLDAFLNKKYFL